MEDNSVTKDAPLGLVGSAGKRRRKPRIQDLHPFENENISPALKAPIQRSTTLSRGFDFNQDVKEYEMQLIERAVQLAGGTIARAAIVLGMSRTTLSMKIKLYNMDLSAVLDKNKALKVA